jgi:hypothetical protein
MVALLAPSLLSGCVVIDLLSGKRHTEQGAAQTKDSLASPESASAKPVIAPATTPPAPQVDPHAEPVTTQAPTRLVDVTPLAAPTGAADGARPIGRHAAHKNSSPIAQPPRAPAAPPAQAISTLPATATADKGMRAFKACRSGLLVPPRSGQGSPDQTIYAPNILFPIAAEFEPVIGTAVYAPGGQLAQPKINPGQCDARLFQLPWRDNFCEMRSGVPSRPKACPGTAVAAHQGNDIRAGGPALCKTMARQKIVDHASIPILAVADGVITRISDYVVYLRSERTEASNAISMLEFRYLHMNPSKLLVSEGQPVKRGQKIGYMSRWFGKKWGEYATLVHLHFEIHATTKYGRFAPLPVYPSLVAAYHKTHDLIDDKSCAIFPL